MLAILTIASSTKLQHKRNIEGGYGYKTPDPVGPDLHNSKFCTDISSWGDIEWTGKTIEKCNTTFVKTPETRWERVCDNVTEITCDIVPYTKCELEWIHVEYKGHEPITKHYIPWVCDPVNNTIPHTKMVPKCYNETKLNCVTLWKEDENGTSVWAGNGDCEEVTWKRCELVPVIKSFIVPGVQCERKGEVIDWEDCLDTTENIKTTQLTCKVFHTTDCKPKTTKQCRQIEYTEWFEKPVKTCENVTILMPNQTWEHKKKCLFQDHVQDPSHTGNYGYDNDNHRRKQHDSNNRVYGEKKEKINLKGNKRTKESNENSSFNQAKKSWRKLPTHASIDGFDLQNHRNGKSVSPEPVSITSSTSEVISVGKNPSDAGVANNQIQEVEI